MNIVFAISIPKIPKLDIDIPAFLKFIFWPPEVINRGQNWGQNTYSWKISIIFGISIPKNLWFDKHKSILFVHVRPLDWPPNRRLKWPQLHLRQLFMLKRDRNVFSVSQIPQRVCFMNLILPKRKKVCFEAVEAILRRKTKKFEKSMVTPLCTPQKKAGYMQIFRKFCLGIK